MKTQESAETSEPLAPAAGTELLRERLGGAFYERRMALQNSHEARVRGQGGGVFRFERVFPVFRVAEWVFRCAGLYRRGRRNYLAVSPVEREWRFPKLPRAFDGFRILHLSDLHLDLDPDLAEVVAGAVGGLEYDLCVNTGDFRCRTTDCFQAAMDAVARVAASVSAPHFGVLGNHDYIEKVPVLEQMGIRMLINENHCLERDGERIWLCGVDDPHFYRMDDLQASRRGVPAGGFSLLLAHSPEVHHAAAVAGFDFMLSGHTHGGQICLPGGFPLITHCRAGRAFAGGPWASAGMPGYTSRGTGGGAIPLRFNCPPDVTLHVLRRG